MAVQAALAASGLMYSVDTSWALEPKETPKAKMQYNNFFTVPYFLIIVNVSFIADPE